MATITAELPWPPSVNHYWRRAGSHMHISAEGRRFRADVTAMLFGQLRKPLEGELDVEVSLYPPDRRRRDVDNSAKALLDAVQHAGIYQDDTQIGRLLLVRCEVVTGGKAVVRIKKMGE
jgi:crossover junction endodeoxyribonuclease RusA